MSYNDRSTLDGKMDANDDEEKVLEKKSDEVKETEKKPSKRRVCGMPLLFAFLAFIIACLIIGGGVGAAVALTWGRRHSSSSPSSSGSPASPPLVKPGATYAVSGLMFSDQSLII